MSCFRFTTPTPRHAPLTENIEMFSLPYKRARKTNGAKNEIQSAHTVARRPSEPPTHFTLLKDLLQAIRLSPSSSKEKKQCSNACPSVPVLSRARSVVAIPDAVPTPGRSSPISLLSRGGTDALRAGLARRPGRAQRQDDRQENSSVLHVGELQARDRSSSSSPAWARRGSW